MPRAIEATASSSATRPAPRSSGAPRTREVRHRHGLGAEQRIDLGGQHPEGDEGADRDERARHRKSPRRVFRPLIRARSRGDPDRIAYSPRRPPLIRTRSRGGLLERALDEPAKGEGVDESAHGRQGDAHAGSILDAVLDGAVRRGRHVVACSSGQLYRSPALMATLRSVLREWTDIQTEASAAICARRGIPFVDVAHCDLDEGFWADDGFHPSAAGYEMAAGMVARVVLTRLEDCDARDDGLCSAVASTGQLAS